MKQIKIAVRKEIKHLDASLKILKKGIVSTKLTKKGKAKMVLDIEEMITLLKSTKK